MKLAEVKCYVIDFVCLYTELPRFDAIRYLAERAGVKRMLNRINRTSQSLDDDTRKNL